MPSTFNREQVVALTEKLEKARAIYFTDYLGLDVSSVTELRKIFFEEKLEFHVAKNTLIKLAAENNKIKGLEDFLSGPTALAISYDEPTKPAKVIKKFAKEHDKPEVKGILFEGKVLQNDSFDSIASLPSREELLSHFVGTIQSPLSGVVRTLNASMSNMVHLLTNVKDLKNN
ncbi:MAG: 50S ribosomal protein L10 [Candidatus Marinimicrobia bacterium]|mgnify:CR=1 FL=1|jgi:large subunit ribosomal protein L10|nr:50S ribosomal protein L10 [Candidatus Neomarinimicrobiota bacterium]HJM47185.1 50S ribosomal protein L10 [Candidatus Neomarinimicrobiota bacterium]|tara:strand:+ start:40 stop:558 length:519 start_codon:yes stop_codon:yes gene_type:complete